MAAELAKGMNVTLGKPIYATNTVSASVVGPRFMANAMARVSDTNQQAPLAIEAQRVESTATVQIIYAIE
jgi:hypothetical protein